MPCRAARSRALQALAIGAAAALRGARAQVRSVTFDDIDATSGTVGGRVNWRVPDGGDTGIHHYAVYLAEDAIGTNQVQVGSSVTPGMYPPEFDIPTGTATWAYTHVLVYYEDSGGVLSNAASVCLLDYPDAFVRTVYMTTTGYTNADAARAQLVANCYANSHNVELQQVATAALSSGAVIVTDFDYTSDQSASAAYSLSFSTSASIDDVEAALASYTSNAPLPAVFTGSSADASYSLGQVRATSDLGGFSITVDEDIGHYIVRSCVQYNLASSAMVDRSGYVRIMTMADKQSAVTSMVQVYQSWSTPAFEDMGGSSSTLSGVATSATASSATCWQISGTDGDPSCT